MKLTILVLNSILIFFGCSSTKTKNGQNSVLSQVDTAEIMDVAENYILQELHGQHIRKTKINSSGSRFIEFYQDTTGISPDEIIWEYCQLQKESIIVGKLNSDKVPVFAIRTIGGATISPNYQYKWLIFMKSKGDWIPIQNNFGGGPPFDLETIKAIENGILTTEFQPMDDETMLLKDSFETRQYDLKNMSLTRKNL